MGKIEKINEIFVFELHVLKVSSFGPIPKIEWNKADNVEKEHCISNPDPKVLIIEHFKGQKIRILNEKHLMVWCDTMILGENDYLKVEVAESDGTVKRYAVRLSHLGSYGQMNPLLQ